MKPLACFLMVLAVAIATGLPLPTWAARSPVQAPEQSITSDAIARRLGRYRFRVRASRYRRGGFSRGPGCPKHVDITALTPVQDELGTSLGNNAAAYLTASDHPTFFLHLPPLPATTGKLTIHNTDASLPLSQRQVYETNFAITGQSGILGIRIPETAVALQIGNTYSWQVSIICPADTASGTPESSMAYFGGVIERVADITGTPAERLDFYLAQGIWQEALLLTLEAHQNTPSNSSAQRWSTLMTDVGLEQFSTQPFLGIVNGQ